MGTNQVIGGESKLTLAYQCVIPFFSAFGKNFIIITCDIF